MNLAVIDFVNELPQSTSLGDCTSFIQETAEKNPIDEFQDCLLQILSYGSAQRLDENKFLGRLLLIGLVSATENYIRGVISSTLSLCPVAQTCASERSVNFGAILWHSGTRFSRSAFEHHSLAEGKGIRSALKDYLSLELPLSNFSGLLDEYDKICQLRHGIVHASGFLPGRNALKLQIPRKENTAEIVIRFKQLQDSAAVLNSMVKNINRYLFNALCKRRALDWRKRNDWDPSQEIKKFGILWSVYLCRSELANRPGRTKITMKACLAKVKKEYAI